MRTPWLICEVKVLLYFHNIPCAFPIAQNELEGG